jgi:hypothetical protein
VTNTERLEELLKWAVLYCIGEHPSARMQMRAIMSASVALLVARLSNKKSEDVFHLLDCGG